MGGPTQTQQTNQNTISNTNSSGTTNYGQHTGQTFGQTSGQNSTQTYDPSALGKGYLTAGTQSAAGGISQYLNPYQADVINATMKQLGQQWGQQQSDILGNAISAGALGGDRQAVAQELAATQFANQVAEPALSNLNMQNYNQALGASQADLARELQAAGMSGGTTTGASTGNVSGQSASNTRGSGSTAGETHGQTIGTGTTTTQTNPGIMGDIGAGIGLLGLLKDGGAVRRDAGGGVSDGGLSSIFPLMLMRQSQAAPAAPPLVSMQQPAPAASNQSGFGSDLAKAYKAGQQAGKGLSDLTNTIATGQPQGNGVIGKLGNVSNSLFGSSSPTTAGPGGWQTGTQTSGALGSGGIGQTFAGMFAKGGGVHPILQNFGHALKAVKHFADGGDPDNDPIGSVDTSMMATSGNLSDRMSGWTPTVETTAAPAPRPGFLTAVNPISRAEAAPASEPAVMASPQSGLTPDNTPLPTRNPSAQSGIGEALNPDLVAPSQSLGLPKSAALGAPTQPGSGIVTKPNPFAAGASPLTGRQGVVQTMVQEMRDAGMSDNAIRGVLANSKDESGFNPGLRHPDQPRWGGEAHFAHGLYQEGGAEWNHYADWLKQNAPGADWRDPRLQTRFLAQNLQQNYPAVWKAMNEGTPEQAAQTFVNGYLKPRADFAAARSSQYGRGVPGLEDFLNGVTGAAKQGLNTLGQGLHDVGEGVSGGISSLAQGVKGTLAKGFDQSGDQAQHGYQDKHDAHTGGLLSRIFGVDFNPLNLTSQERTNLIRTGAAMMQTGNLGAGLNAGLNAAEKAKAQERQARLDAQKLNMELQKLQETKDWHQGRLDQENWGQPLAVKDKDGNEHLIQYDKRSGEVREVPGYTGIVGKGGAGNAGGVSKWKYDTWLANHPGDTKGAEDYAAGRKSMSDAEIRKAASQAALNETKDYMGKDKEAHTQERAEYWYKWYHQNNGAAAPAAPAPAPPAAPAQPASAQPQQQPPAQKANPLDKARAAIAAGAPREAVIERLRQNGIDPAGL